VTSPAGHPPDPPAAPEPQQPAKVHYYYVDEAGDPNLFNAAGHVIAGRPGCSRYFILGKLEVFEPDGLAAAIQELRQRLLADPYFSGVPSMMPDRKKTARMFHAKDDVPEVRREVFQLLQNVDVRFYALIRDKQVIASKVLAHNQKQPGYRYHPNHLYDRCIPPLFENRLHQYESYRIVFARRGSSDRTAAFEKGLQQARARFREKWSIERAAPIEVVASDPAKVSCLQATDYFLWAVQRCFERGERRYLDLIWPKVGLIVDRDNTARKGFGEYYTRERPIPQDFTPGAASKEEGESA
jgi:hypothetical protein